jgi:hypothetical protein
MTTLLGLSVRGLPHGSSSGHNVNARTAALGRTLWVDMGWPACDERLATVAEANRLRVGRATTRLPDVR